MKKKVIKHSETDLFPIKEKRPVPISVPPKVSLKDVDDPLGAEFRLNSREVDAYQALAEAVGTRDPDLTDFLVKSIIRATPSLLSGERPPINAALAILHGIESQDVLERLQVAAMIPIYVHAMKCMREANFEATAERKDAKLIQSSRLMQTFTRQVEVLTRYKTRGCQKVIVEHLSNVSVNSGGQAIVGKVTGGRRRGTESK